MSDLPHDRDRVIADTGRTAAILANRAERRGYSDLRAVPEHPIPIERDHGQHQLRYRVPEAEMYGRQERRRAECAGCRTGRRHCARDSAEKNRWLI